MEYLAIILFIAALYLFIKIANFKKQQIEHRILTYLDFSPRERKQPWLNRVKNYLMLFRKNNNSEELDNEVAELSDLLALALVAGRSPSQALSEIEALLPAKIADVIRSVLLKNSAGVGFDKALQETAEKAANEAFIQFVKTLQAAMERGTPLAENLRSFSHDLRSRSKEKLLSSASKREIAMLVPIVFVVLPTVLVIAIYPALQVIRNLS